jgi:hypothetical protein
MHIHRFDLSPRNIERKLGSKAEIAKLVYMVFKVATDLQPSVVYIDDIDKVSTLHTRPTHPANPSDHPRATTFDSLLTLLTPYSIFQVWLKSKGKSVPEIVRMKNCIMMHKPRLTLETRVLVIGNSRIPYGPLVDRKELTKFFGAKNDGKMLFCPCPSYSTRLKLWAHFIAQTGMDLTLLEKNPQFDINTLAYISEGYSAGNIFQAVTTTLPERRVAKITESKKTLESTEFISALSKTSYTYKNDYVAFQEFTDDTSGAKERRELKEKAEGGGDDKKGDKKKGSKKGSKKKK